MISNRGKQQFILSIVVKSERLNKLQLEKAIWFYNVWLEFAWNKPKISMER